MGKIGSALVGKPCQAHPREQRVGCLGHIAQCAARHKQAVSRMAHLRRNTHVFMRAELAKHVGDLKALGNAQTCKFVLRFVRDVLPFKQHAPCARRQRATDEIEKGAFACAVGADDGGELLRGKGHAHVLQRGEGAKTFAQALHTEQGWRAHCLGSIRCPNCCANCCAIRCPSQCSNQCSTEPQMPRGKKSTKIMKTAPTAAIQ